MREDGLSIEELEDLSYYDFLGYMDVLFFNIGAVGPIDRLAELCGIRCLDGSPTQFSRTSLLLILSSKAGY